MGQIHVPFGLQDLQCFCQGTCPGEDRGRRCEADDEKDEESQCWSVQTPRVYVHEILPFDRVNRTGITQISV